MDRVTSYAEKTVKEEIMGKLHILACKRHLMDLSRQGTQDFPYIWNSRLSENTIDLANEMTIIEGTEPKRLTLYPHQNFDVGILYGWVHKDTGFRRFRRNYKSIARQNGKSFENGIHGIKNLSFMNYREGRLFTAATKRDQAKLVWDEVSKFIRGDKDLEEIHQVKEYSSTIISNVTNNSLKALSKEGGLDEGFRAIYVSLDELHQMRDDSVYDSLYRGQTALNESLISMITTRGLDLNSFAFTMDSHAKNILLGIITDETFFVDIYTIDEEDSYFEPKALRKANPTIYEDPEAWKNLLSLASDAKNMGGSQLAKFVTKSANCWYRDINKAFIDWEAWEGCGIDADITGKSCYIGIDLSSGGDLTSIGFDFIDVDGVEDYFLSHSFMPKGRFEEHIKSDLAPYDVWEKAGLLTLTGTSQTFITDYLFLIDWLHQFVDFYKINIKGIGYDRSNVSSILSYLDDFGADLQEITQSARALNDATQSIRLKTKSKTLGYDKKDELLSWAVGNAKIDTNSFGEIKLDKKTRTQRIDPADAIVIAHALRLDKQGDRESLDALIKAGKWSM